MAEINKPIPGGDPGRAPGDGSGGMFAAPKPEARSFPFAALVIAALVVIVGVGIYAAMARKQAAPAGSPNALQPLAAYSPQLKLTNVAMSESTSFSGGKETYIDGHITNTGPATVTGITTQVLFAPEGGGSPQMETVPMNLIRMRQPYIDVQPVSAAPLAPGAGADFRLIFEDIRPEWNQQTPEIHLTAVSTR